MTILKHPIFFSSVVIASTLYIAQQLNVPLPSWLYYYINDFLCIPIVLSLCLAILRILKRTETLFVPFTLVLALTLYFTIYFEWFMPYISARYTFDYIDIGLYFLGAILFFKFQKKLF